MAARPADGTPPAGGDGIGRRRNLRSYLLKLIVIPRRIEELAISGGGAGTGEARTCPAVGAASPRPETDALPTYIATERHGRDFSPSISARFARLSAASCAAWRVFTASTVSTARSFMTKRPSIMTDETSCPKAE